MHFQFIGTGGGCDEPACGGIYAIDYLGDLSPVVMQFESLIKTRLADTDPAFLFTPANHIVVNCTF